VENSEEIRKLLQEIRDVEREHLAEYRRVTSLSLELQQRAVARQEQFGRISRMVFLIGGIVAAALLALLIYLLARWSRQLMGI